MTASRHASVLTLERDAARALARVRARALNRALARARALALDIAFDVDAARALGLDFDDVRDLGLDLDAARDRARGLGLGLDLDAARDLTRDLDHVLDLDLGRILNLDLERVLACARELVRAIEIVRGLDVRDQRRRQAVRLAPVAERLLAVAARLLPASDRVRYAGEFGSELWEIAHAGGRRRAQLAYAARQVRSAWRLGRELQARNAIGLSRDPGGDDARADRGDPPGC